MGDSVDAKRRRRRWSWRNRGAQNDPTAFFVRGFIGHWECEALWHDGTLVIDEPLLDQASVVEALGETSCLLGVSLPCRVDPSQPQSLMVSLLVALDEVCDVRLALAEDPAEWREWGGRW